MGNLQIFDTEVQNETEENEQAAETADYAHYKPNKPIYGFFKRSFDFMVSALLLIVLSPFFLVISFLVYFGDPGKVFYGHVRIGKNGKPFKMWKFRSMYQNSDKMIDQLTPEQKQQYYTEFKIDNDPRITPIGNFLRKTSLDELPQLFNVLKGDMSLVGPRPERPQFVEKFKEEIPRYMVKHQVRPGLTGWAQVNGLRGDSSIKKRIEYDIYYIENWTIGFDIKIILMTFFTGFINKNAY